MAHIIWLWRLIPTNKKLDTTKNSINEILNLDNELKNIDLDDNPYLANIDGFASVGTYYNTNKPFEIAFVINFLDSYLKDDKKDWNFIKILKDLKSEVTINGANDLEDGKIVKGKNESSTKKASIFNALLYLFEPNEYEPILSNTHKEKIVKVFSKFLKDNNKETIDQKILKIKKELIEKLNNTEDDFSFYDDNIKNLWLSDIDFESKNIILHGAPGTGKTYLTEESIKARKIIEENLEYELVQFHPNYDYEDFIEGIKPIEINQNTGQMQFELKNGIFKEMCIKAFKELVKAKNENREPKKFYFIADEINRAELSRVFGELLLCLEDDKRLRFDKNGNLQGTKIKLQNASLWQKHHAVVILDKDGNVVEPNKNGENEKDVDMYFGIPENLYFIGTMNDIDRSVDSFDMALRRRFVWKKYECDYDVIADKFKDIDEEKVLKYIEVCRKLNEHITSDKGFGLGDEFELGHYYFMKPKKLNQTQLDQVWVENIAPLLREYLRSIEEPRNIEKKLKEAKNIFKI